MCGLQQLFFFQCGPGHQKVGQPCRGYDGSSACSRGSRGRRGVCKRAVGEVRQLFSVIMPSLGAVSLPTPHPECPFRGPLLPHFQVSVFAAQNPVMEPSLQNAAPADGTLGPFLPCPRHHDSAIRGLPVSCCNVSCIETVQRETPPLTNVFVLSRGIRTEQMF